MRQTRQDERTRDKKGRGQDVRNNPPKDDTFEETAVMTGLAKVVVKIGRARYFISGLGDLKRLLKKGFDEDESCLILGYRSSTNKPREKRLYYLFRDLLGSNSGLRARSRWGDLQERYLFSHERGPGTVTVTGTDSVPEPEPTQE